MTGSPTLTSSAPNTGYWVHELSPFWLRFPEGWPVEGLRWYGLAYLLSGIFAFALLRLYIRRGRLHIDAEAAWNLMLVVFASALLGGRLGFFLLYHPASLLQEPFAFFRIWHGGMSFHGGVLGGVLALVLFAKAKGIPWGHLADVGATVLPIGIFLGRVGNFINGELYGTPTQVPWAMHFWTGNSWTEPVHPSQLYEAGLEGLLLGFYLQMRFWLGEKLPAGRLFAEALVLYALLRIFAEQFRQPDAALIFGMSRGSFYSLALMLAGGLLLWKLWAKRDTIRQSPL